MAFQLPINLQLHQQNCRHPVIFEKSRSRGLNEISDMNEEKFNIIFEKYETELIYTLLRNEMSIKCRKIGFSSYVGWVGGNENILWYKVNLAHLIVRTARLQHTKFKHCWYYFLFLLFQSESFCFCFCFELFFGIYSYGNSENFEMQAIIYCYILMAHRHFG